MMKTKLFCRISGAWKVMSQHIFPSLTVVLLTLFALNLNVLDLEAQTEPGVCSDPPPIELTVTAETPVNICIGNQARLSIEVSGGVQGISRSFAVYRTTAETNVFSKRNLNDTNLSETPLGRSSIMGAATFVEGDYFTIDLDSNQLIVIDTSNGSIQDVIGSIALPQFPFNHVWAGLAYNETNSTLYAISTHLTCKDNSNIYTINPATASISLVGSVEEEICVQWLGINSQGEAFILNENDNSLYHLDLENGDVELIGDIGHEVTSCTGGDFDPVSGELFITVNDGDNVIGLLVDPVTGQAGVVGERAGSVCGLALLNQSFQGYEFNWSPSDGLSDTDIAEPYADPIVSTLYTVTVTDACGNTATADVMVNVEEPADPTDQISCNLNVQVSLNADCEAIVTPDMILVGDVPCANEEHTVDVAGRGTNMVGIDDIDQTLTVEVIRNGNNGNRCWGSIEVKDKLKPTIMCSTDTITCLEMIDFPLPDADDNCGDVEVFLSGQNKFDLCSDYPGLIRKIERTYFAVDASGNQSETCVQTLYIETVNTEEISFPSDFIKEDGTNFSCNENLPLTNMGFPSPDTAGYPSIGGVNIGDLNDLCGVSAVFEDRSVISNNCKTIFDRIWTIYEHCNGGWEATGVATQRIEILDDVNPTITCPSDITVTTSSSHNCAASVFIPRPSASDMCSDIESIALDIIDGNYYFDWGGGNLSFPAGETTLQFTAFDDCGNSSSCTTKVIVNDMTPPVPVCKETTVVSLTNDGTARVFAESFDNGSYDECGGVSLDVRRMDQGCDINDPIFRPYVDFYCCDLADNPIMVVLRVTDESGNQNECMVNVEVQDKLPASITCPPNITVSCEYPFDLDDLTVFGKVVIVSDLAQLQNPALDPREPIIIDDIGDNVNPQPRNWGIDGFAYDNCALTVTDSYFVNEGLCGTDTIIRTFTAMALNNTPSASCHQTITIENLNPFVRANITWPRDTMLLNTCVESPDIHPDNLGYPEYEQGVCDNVHYTYKDVVFRTNNSNDPTCFKVMREWTVIDWCQYDKGHYHTWVKQQTIKVTIDDAPVITGNCDDITVNSIDPDCQSAAVSLTQSATSVCTAEEDLIWRYDIDVNNNGVFELNSSYNPFDENPLDPTNASGEYPIGDHRIVWTVTDGCGNTNTCQQIFTILNTTQPKVICQSLTIGLMPMSSGGSGPYDWAMLELPASEFDKASYHACGYDVTFAYSEDPNDTTRVFTCDDLGEQMVAIYVHSANGVFDFCVTVGDIQDNNNACPPGSGSSGGSNSGLISGLISMEDGESVKDAEVNLVGSPLDPVMTTSSGNYQFPAMPFGGSYEVLPYKNDNPLDGVTTYDIALIQRHILGTQFFQTPYQWIAADIDNNGVVDVRDVSALRRLILGTNDDFQNNTSWRFVDADYHFSGFNPLDEHFNESYRIPDFNSNMTGLDFIAVKIGDINNSVDPSGVNQSDERSQSHPLVFEIIDNSFQSGDLVELSFSSRDFLDIDAFQFTLLFDERQLDLIEVRSEALIFENSNIGMQALDQGILTVSWNDFMPISANEDEVLFTLVFESSSYGSLASAIQISSLVTEARAYERGQAKNIGLEFSNLLSDSNNFELYQNRPNPFTDETVIGFRLAEDSEVTLTIFDVTGKVVITLDGKFNRGYNELRLNDLGDWAGQVYYYRLDTEGFSATKKMILVR